MGIQVHILRPLLSVLLGHWHNFFNVATVTVRQLKYTVISGNVTDDSFVGL